MTHIKQKKEHRKTKPKQHSIGKSTFGKRGSKEMDSPVGKPTKGAVPRPAVRRGASRGR